MRRFPATTLGLISISVLLLALAACSGGGSVPNSGVTQIAITPTTATLQQGGTVQITATPEDASNNTITKVTPTFSVNSAQNLISVSVGGLVCAGQWDSLVAPINCTPTTNSGEATVTATAGTVTASVTVAVLPPVDKIAVVPVQPDPAFPADPAGLNCISQSTTRTYTITASFRGNNVDLSNLTHAVTWSLDSTTVGSIAAQTTTDASGNTITDSRFAVATAIAPGKTQVVANLGNLRGSFDANGQPAQFITCPVKQITLADKASPATAMPVSSGTTITLVPTITDSRGNPVLQSKTDSSGTTTTLFSLNWNSSQPAAAAVSGGIITPTSAGGTTAILASCTPPTCNFNLGAVYSKPFMTAVTGTTATTIYVGSSNSTTLLPITMSTNTYGTALTLPAAPNSMVFNPLGSTLYIGTASGLVSVVTSTNIVSAALTGAPGKILAVSPDGNTILVSDGSHLYAVAAAGTVQTYNVSGITAADFAPDSSKAYLVATNQFAVYSTGGFPVSQPLPGTTDVSFLASGAFSFIGNGAGIGIYATCNDTPAATTVGGISSAPAILSTLPDGSHLLAVNTPNVNLVGVNTDNIGFLNSASGCAPSVSSALNQSATFSSSFTPNQLIITTDGTRAFIPSDQAQLLGVTISGDTIAAQPITLSGNVAQTTGGVTLDGKQLYIGGKDNQVHRIDLTSNTDTPIALPSTAPAGFTTDFVAVQP